MAIDKRNIFVKVGAAWSRTFGRMQGLRRSWWLRLTGAHIGVGTFMPVTEVPHPHQVWIGDNCKIQPHCVFDHSGWNQEGRNLIIGSNCYIGEGVEFTVKSKLVVGEATWIAAGCRFFDYNHGINANQPVGAQPLVTGPITVGSDVWIGCNAVILKDVTIGDGAIVGAGAVVAKNVPAREIWGGVPAKKIGERP